MKKGRKINTQYMKGYFDALSFIIREIPMPLRNKIALNILQGKILVDILKR